MGISKSIAVCATVLQLMSAGCSTPQRLDAVPYASMPLATSDFGPVRYLVTRDTKEFQAEALRALAKEKAWLRSHGSSQTLPPAYYLAISGGGDNGAFGAGLLNGWTASGTRPEFKVVTGVSTGALIAPFAFLGPRYDGALERFYTTISGKDIFKSRGVVRGMLSDAMADSKPLAKLIANNCDQKLLDVIAVEYAKGRILLVATTNMDSLEPVIWNMTAIAASKNPKALMLFRTVLLASASIPGAFPPVMIDVQAQGVRYQEMHADGGTVAQVFLYPPSISKSLLNGMAPRQRTLYVIRNARLDPQWQNVPRKTAKIAERAIGSLTTTQGIGDLYRIYSTTHRDGIDFNLAYIPSSFQQPGGEPFDTAYMRALFAVGKKEGQLGIAWLKQPPGFEAPIETERAK